MTAKQPGRRRMRTIGRAAAAAALAGATLPTAFATPALAVPQCTPESAYEHCVPFAATGADQTFTVPAGVYSLRVKLWAGGGSTGASAGGGGGFTVGTVAVTPGQQFTVTVGDAGQGASIAATYGGGGAGGLGDRDTVSRWTNGGSGGGMSALWKGSYGTHPLLIAGGGGAGAATANGYPGGAGGGATGESPAYPVSGRGATQQAGGAAGVINDCTSATAGGHYTGGTGADGYDGGGGGGGGYYGGGGGECQATDPGTNREGGGGGGSGYVASAGVSGASTTAGSGAVTGGSADAQWNSAAGNAAEGGMATIQYNVSSVPPAPSAVTAVAGVSSVKVSWHAPSGPTVTGYTAYAKPGPATCTTDGATTCVLGGTAGVAYTVTVVAHTSGGDSPRSAASDPATPTAPAPPDSPPSTSLELTTDEGDITTAERGEEIVFIGTGFAEHSTVVISVYSTPVVLGTVVTDGSGNFRKGIVVPAGLAAGTHTIIAQGVGPDGRPRAMKLTVTVTDAAILAVTGARTTLVAGAGVALLLAGAAALRLTRRRPLA
ncbi:hypothetical protein GCM10010123_45430 [Pilimelia anulata]|uniref:receptor protein-tyrosine kinase n=1 Tax=Pilimelia anulata TaxID=53371 RepID=A0A8J3FGM2_9ACTN|nr:fibronectin type III domain-containing protein [Pilimelia anulata]GGK10344.1 hypothetical protein GCM10010123_45430 [Pilimelia anulata]